MSESVGTSVNKRRDEVYLSGSAPLYIYVGCSTSSDQTQNGHSLTAD